MTSGVFACFTSSNSLFILSKIMTAYNLEPPVNSLPNPPWQEKKEKRRQQLEEVRRRRRLMYQLMRKMQQSKKTEKPSYY